MDPDATGIDGPDDLETLQDAAQLLGVDVDASDDEIDSAYQDAVLEFHPDTGGDPELFIAVDRARDYLKGERDPPGGRGVTQDTDEPTETEDTSTESTSDTGGWRRAAGFDKEASKAVLDSVKKLLRQNTTEEALKDKYGEHATIDRVANILATMIINGAIDLGDVNKMLNEGIRFGPNADAATGGIFTGDRSGGGLFGGGSGGMYSSDPNDYMNFDASPDGDEDEDEDEGFGGV